MTYRRDFIRTALGGSTVLLLTACAGGSATSPAAPTAAGAAPKPTTGAPAPTAPANAAPTAVPAAAAPKPTTIAPTTPAAAAAGAASDLDQLYADAKKEGHVTWWTAHYAQEAADAVQVAFVAKYPGIEVEFIRQTAQVVYQRLTESLKAGTHAVDVFASTDESHYLTLKPQGVFAQYTPVGVDALSPAYRQIDPDQTYHVGALGFVLVNYNTSKVQKPPQTWNDLLDPQWKEQITVGHPGFSGFVGNWVVAMMDKYGWDYFTKLAQNDPKIGRSINDTVTDIVAGERTVGAGPDNYSLSQKAGGNPIDVQFPTDDAISIVSPVAILKDAPHPNAARLFESFFYTKEYSETMAKTFNYPLRTDVASPSGKSPDQIKSYRNKGDRLQAGIPEAIAKWRETFGV
jgi:iron(III) transport system substrate-binding protein